MTVFGLELSALTVLTCVAWICACGWLVFAAVALYGLKRRGPLSASQDARTADGWPLVSVLIPARNEAHRVLAESVRSVLAQDYERLEVVAVNDRSTDATESILRSIAEGDGRLRVIRGAEPPAGWLGKPYALQQALEASRGQWVLMLAAGASVEWSRMLVVPSLLIWATQVVTLMFICRNSDIPVAYALTTPLGLSLFYSALLVSLTDIVRGKGLAWKERRVYERAGVELPGGRLTGSGGVRKNRV